MNLLTLPLISFIDAGTLATTGGGFGRGARYGLVISP